MKRQPLIDYIGKHVRTRRPMYLIPMRETEQTVTIAPSTDLFISGLSEVSGHVIADVPDDSLDEFFTVDLPIENLAHCTILDHKDLRLSPCKKDYTPSLWCRIFGHKFWVTAVNIVHDEEASAHTGSYMLRRDKKHQACSHCQRCGVPNPTTSIG